MAAAVLVSNKVISFTPFLIRKCVVTAGTDGLAITHGEDRAPDIILGISTTTNPTASEHSVVRTSATVVTVDFEGAGGTGDAEFYLIWISQASGGIS
jgi:hypothetical protein